MGAHFVINVIVKLILMVIDKIIEWLGKLLSWELKLDTTELPLPTPQIPTPAIISNPAPEPLETANNGQSAPSTALLWDTPSHCFKSTRIMCDSAGLSVDEKNEICYTIWGESEFITKAIGKPNKNGTRDYGLGQYNDGENAKDIPFWIGKGATFSSIDEVLNNPEKNVRVMIQEYKNGHIGWWYGHSGYTQERARTSKMWSLKGV